METQKLISRLFYCRFTQNDLLNERGRETNITSTLEICQMKSFKNKILDMEIFSKKKFHKFIQHISQVKKDKEGNIINILLHGQESYIFKTIQTELTEPWRKFSKLEREDIRLVENDDLRLDIILKSDGQYHQRYNQAISYEFSNLTTVRLIMEQQQKKVIMDMNFYNMDAWEMYKQYILAQRMIPLNKNAQNIAQISNLRPIMIQTHLVKLVEWSQVFKFKENLAQRMMKNQVGFVQHLGTQVQIIKLLLELKKNGNKIMQLSSSYLMHIIHYIEKDLIR